MRNSLYLSLTGLLGTLVFVLNARASDVEYYADHLINADKCTEYFKIGSGFSKDKKTLMELGYLADAGVTASAIGGVASGSSVLDGADGSTGRITSAKASTANQNILSCQSGIKRVVAGMEGCISHANRDGNPNLAKKISQELSKFQKLINEKPLSSCTSQYALQVLGQGSAAAGAGTSADHLSGSGGGASPNNSSPPSDKPGILSSTGGFLKNNAVPLGVGAVAGLGAYMLMGQDDDKKKKPKDTETTDDDAEETDADKEPTEPVDLVIDVPTTNLTQTDNFAKIPTEQTTPSTATANVTVHDPAYTGIGAPQGDTSGARDQSAAPFVTDLVCMPQESDAACRTRLACTATEPLETCAARWDAGTVRVAAQ